MILLTKDVYHDITKIVIYYRRYKRRKIMFYSSLTAKLEQRTEHTRDLAKIDAEKRARKQIRSLNRRLEKAADKGNKSLVIMSADAPYRYNSDKHYDLEFEATRMAMDIVLEECQNRNVKVEIRNPTNCPSEYMLVVFW